MEIISVIVSSLIGVVMLSYGLERYVGYFSAPIGILPAIGLIGFSMLLIIPGTVTDLIGLAGWLFILALIYLRRKKTSAKQ